MSHWTESPRRLVLASLSENADRTKHSGLEVLIAPGGRHAALSASTTSFVIAALLGLSLAVTAWIDTFHALGHGYDRVLWQYWLVSSLGAAIPVAATTGWGKVNIALLSLPAVVWPPAMFLLEDSGSWFTEVLLWSPFWCWIGIMANAVIRLRKARTFDAPTGASPGEPAESRSAA